MQFEDRTVINHVLLQKNNKTFPAISSFIGADLHFLVHKYVLDTNKHIMAHNLRNYTLGSCINRYCSCRLCVIVKEVNIIKYDEI